MGNQAHDLLMAIATNIIKLASLTDNLNASSVYSEDVIIVEETKQNDFKGNYKGKTSKEGSNNTEIRKESEDTVKKGSLIYREKEKRWMGRYSNKVCVYAATKKECAEKLNKAIKDYENGIKIETKQNTIGKQMKLSLWLDHWLVTYKKPSLKESSYFNRVQYVERIKKYPLAEKQMSKIEVSDIVGFLDSFDTKGAKKNNFQILQEAFGKAYANGYLSKDITSFVAYDFENKDEVQDEIEEEVKILTLEEEKSFLELLKEKNIDLYFAVKFLIYSGLRTGELFALSLNDFDFDYKTIKINKQLNKTTGKITTPKTKSSVREIPMFDALEQLIQDIVLVNSVTNKNERLFKKLNQKAFPTNLVYFSTNYGFDKITPHMLRHTFASKCYAMGIDAKQVAKWLGHSSVKTTQDIYTHLGLGDKTEAKAVNMFNKLTPNL